MTITYNWGEDFTTKQWWLVEFRDGEPYVAYHPEHGSKRAWRDTFWRWHPFDLATLTSTSGTAEPATESRNGPLEPLLALLRKTHEQHAKGDPYESVGDMIRTAIGVLQIYIPTPVEQPRADVQGNIDWLRNRGFIVVHTDTVNKQHSPKEELRVCAARALLAEVAPYVYGNETTPRELEDRLTSVLGCDANHSAAPRIETLSPQQIIDKLATLRHQGVITKDTEDVIRIKLGVHDG